MCEMTPGDEDEVDRPLAVHLVGDRGVAAPRVSGPRKHGAQRTARIVPAAVAGEWSNRAPSGPARRARSSGARARARSPDVLEAIEGPGRAHVLLLELPPQVAGAYIARRDLPLLLVNGRQAPARQRFTLAHEFGHHRMGHATRGRRAGRDQRTGASTTPRRSARTPSPPSS